jgi:hypothetical protein
MENCYRCGLPATYYIESRKKWSCDKIAQKCPAVKEKIGKANAISLLGKKMPQHVREILNKAIIGKACPEDKKEKIRQSNLEYWADHTREPWNKGKKGLQTAWNKGKKKEESLEIISRDDPVYSNFRKYRNRIAVRTRKIYKQFKDEINPQDLLIGKCGIEGVYQIDHIISVRIGFEQGISIEEISSKENLQIIPWLDNIKKYDGKGNRKR